MALGRVKHRRQRMDKMELFIRKGKLKLSGTRMLLTLTRILIATDMILRIRLGISLTTPMPTSAAPLACKATHCGKAS
jgi:hypothetical protein